MSTKEIKNKFPIFKNYPELVYLDSAATSQKPQEVLDKIVDFYTKTNANVHRGIYDLSEKATDAYEESRSKIAQFLKVDKREIIFTSGTTEAANIIAGSFIKNHISEDDILLTTEGEHHSNYLPLFEIAKNKNAEIKLMPLTEEGDFNYSVLESILKQFGDKIKIVAFSAVSNVLGYRLDLKIVSKLVREYAHEAKIIIDAAQIVGHHVFYPKENDVDFAFFSGHKVFAETGVGVLWGKHDLLRKMPPFLVGGGMIDHITSEEALYAPAPYRFEAGTPNIAGAISLGAAVDFVENIKIENIESHCKKLIGKLEEELKLVPEIKIYGPSNPQERSSLLAFSVNDIHPHDIAQYLSDKNIAVRAGHHCNQILHAEKLNIPGSVRVSTHIYNTEEDIDKFVTALKKAISYYKK